MERNQLLYVIEAAACGSITKAADKLHISQPSLSNQIISLEKELGIPLFERIRKRIHLTPAGEVFVQEARKIINSFTSLEQLMEEHAHQRTGKIRIGALSIMCSLKIPEMVHDFKQEYSGINISLLESGSASLLQSLEQNEIDAAFVILDSLHALDERLTAIHLMDSYIYVAINKKNPQSQKEAFALEDLTSLPFIITTASFNMTTMILSRMTAAGLPYKITNVCNQIDSCLALVDKDIGISFCARETAEYYGYPEVALVPFTPALTRTVYLVYKKTLEYYPVLKTFISFATDFFRTTYFH